MMKYTKRTVDIADFFGISIPTALKIIATLPDDMKVALPLKNGKPCFRCRDDVFEFLTKGQKNERVD